MSTQSLKRNDSALPHRRKCSQSSREKTLLISGVLIIVGTAIVAGVIIFFSLQTTQVLLPPIKISGKNYMYDNGTLFYPRGINLGGWLVPEYWMCGMDHGSNTAHDRLSLMEDLEARFGETAAWTLINVWYDNWIIEADLDYIQSFGLNHVRVPLNYRNFQYANGTWRLNEKGKIDWSRLDWIVSQASRRGIYVLPVLHVWYDLFYRYDIVSYNNGGDPVLQERANNARTLTSWFLGNLTHHLIGNTNILAIDTINEPTGSADNVLQQTLYNAIRSVDAQRTIVIEWMLQTNPVSYGWTNVVYSNHIYATTNDITKFMEVCASDTRYNFTVPYHVGEMNLDGATLAKAIPLLEAQNIAWSPWSYKGVNVGGWAMRDYYPTVRVNISNDSFDYLLTFWGTRLTRWTNHTMIVNLYNNTQFTDGFVKGMNDSNAMLKVS